MALTEKDLLAITNLIKAENLGLATSAEVRILAEKIDGLPTRDEFMSLIDQVMGKIRSTDQEHTMLTGRVRIHEDRITDLEEIHPGGSHAS